MGQYWKSGLGSFAVLFFVLLFTFLGLYVFSETPFQSSPSWLWNIVAAAVVWSAAAAILITAERYQSKTAPKYPREELKGFPGLAYHILVERQSVLGLFLLFLFVTGVSIYYLAGRLVDIQSTDSGFEVTLRGKVTTYIPLIPTYDGWQNTGIYLRDGQKFAVTITGQVSPGLYPFHSYLTSLKFTGPEGYDPGVYSNNDCPDHVIGRSFLGVSDGFSYFLAKAKPQSPSPTSAVRAAERKRAAAEIEEELRRAREQPSHVDCSYTSTLLNVRNLPHNVVVGKITNDPLGPRYGIGTDAYNGETEGIPVYRLSNNRMSGETYPIQRTAKQDGYLWVLINDGPYMHWDNSGLFLMSVSRDR